MENLILFIILLPMLGAPVSYIIGKRDKNARNIAVWVITFLELALTLYAAVTCQGGEYHLPICGINLKMDGFRSVYTVITAFMWFMTGLLSPQYFAHYHNRNRYYLFNLITLGATQGVFLSSDLLTTFLFFEVMSLASYPWVAHDQTPDAMRAANTYLAVAIIGGLVSLMGLFLLYHLAGTIVVDELYEACKTVANRGMLYAAGGCILFGFGAKAGMFPLHIWLPKAHPVAPAPSSALLSGVLTKAGVYGIIVLCCHIFRYDKAWGWLMLTLGVITMVWGAVLGVMSINLKRTLACSSMSQIGFILVGLSMCCLLGEENALPARGVMLHMINHSLIKLVLFMTAGAIYMHTHTLDLNKLRGFGRKKPILNFCFLMGALGIGGVPLWNGYISKTLLHEGIVEFYAENGLLIVKLAEWLFLFSGGLTVAYMTKLYAALFVEKNNDPETQARYDGMKKVLNPASAVALMGSAIVLPILGMTSGITMNSIAELGQSFIMGGHMEHAVNYFSFENLKGGLISIAIGAAVYYLFIRGRLMEDRDGQQVYVNLLPQWFDLEDMVYRPLLMKILPDSLGGIVRVFGENRVLKPMCGQLMDAAEWIAVQFGENRLLVPLWGITQKAAGFMAELFGENRLLVPICRLTAAASGILSRGLADSVDLGTLALRKTVFRDLDPDGKRCRRVTDRNTAAENRKASIKEGLAEATDRITRGFSFAMLMTTIGVALILGILVWYYLK